MEYKLRYNEETVALAAETDGEGHFQAIVGDNRYDAAFKRISDSCLHLVVNGRQTTAFVPTRPQANP